MKALSISQSQVYYDQLINPSSPKYNIGGYIQFCGLLELDKLEKAIHESTKRIDTFSIKFDFSGDEPLQFYLPEPMIVEVKRLDFRRTGGLDAALRHLDKLFLAPFVLDKDPLYDHGIIEVGEDQWIWYHKCHHLISDGYSFARMCTLVSEIYGELVSAKESRPAELDGSFLDTIASSEKYLASATRIKDAEYWESRFADYRPFSITPDSKDFLSVSTEIELTEELKIRLRDFASRSSCTVQDIFISAIYIYLHYLYGLDRVCMGIALHGRSTQKERATSGMLSHVMPFLLTGHSEMNTLDLIKLVSPLIRQDYRHRRYPISLLKQKLQAQTGLQSGLMQALCIYDQFKYQLDFPGASVIIRQIESSGSEYPLTFRLKDYGDFPMILSIRASSTLPCSTALSDLGARILNLLHKITADAPSSLRSIQPLPIQELHKIYSISRGIDQFIDDRWLLHELYEHRVDCEPNRVALLFGDMPMGYGELNVRANRLARFLQAEIGVGPGSLVGIYIERSFDLIIAIIAILKAGAAYVPLDPDYPKSRLHFFMMDSGLHTLLVNSYLAQNELQIPFESIRCINLNEKAIKECIETQDAENLQSQTTTCRNPLAYVMYTSGSTGKPKGVMIEHQSIISRLRWMQEEYDISTHDTFLHKTPLGFDVSVWEILLPLISGSTLAIAAPGIHKDPRQIIETIRRYKVTHVHFVPSVFELILWLEEEWKLCSSLKNVFLGGERLSQKMGHLHYKLNSARLHNRYGPTEASINASRWNSSEKEIPVSVPIGKPVPGTGIFILNQAGHLLPAGELGELYISGSGLARGYINQPSLTDLAFPNINLLGEGTESHRLYKTGDIGRYLPSGDLEFMGRLDEQVKIRGVRIEIGEIEYHLHQQQEIKAAAVVISNEVQEDQSLIAYVVIDSQVATVEGFEKLLKLRLKDLLPQSMLPSAIIAIDALPLNPNGKVDKTKLKYLNTITPHAAEYRSKSKLEVELSEIFASLLNITSDSIGPDDNFFELGGQSLLAVKLTFLIRKRFGIDFPLRAIYDSQTLSAVAQKISQSQVSANPLPIASTSSTTCIQEGVSPAQLGLWLIDRLEQGSPRYNMTGALLLEGSFVVSTAELAFRKILERHEVLRTVYEEVGGSPRERVLDNYTFLLQQKDLRGSNEDNQQTILDETLQSEASAPFNLAKDLMLRATYIRLSDRHNEGILLITLHHIAGDGISLNILAREFSTYYNYFSVKGEFLDPLPTPKIQFREFIAEQRYFLQSESYQRQLAHWMRHLAELPQAHDLPIHTERTARLTGRTRIQKIEIGKRDVVRMHDLARSTRSTIFVIIHSIFSVLLARHSHSKDIVIGTPVANRFDPKLDDSIGYFVNPIVLRSTIDNNITFHEHLSATRTIVLEAQENQQVPFQHLVSILNPGREIGLHPLFQIMLTMDTYEMSQVQLYGTTVSPGPHIPTPPKFDLVLAIKEVESSLECRFEYNDGLFEQPFIESLAARFQTLTRIFIDNPDNRIFDVDILSNGEKHCLLSDFNSTHANFSSPRSIIERIESNVRRIPNAIAVCDSSYELSASQLYSKALQVAHHLIKENYLREGELVGIYMNRSIDMVVALLGVIMAKGAYVPLDTGLPKSRLAYIVTNASLRLVIVDAERFGTIEELTGKEILLGGLLHPCEDPSPLTPPSENSPAYIIYTSGSTGHPKGVKVNHGNLINYLDFATNEYFGSEFEQGKPQAAAVCTPLAFDATVTSLLVPILGGRRVHLLDQQDEIGGLVKLISNSQVPILFKVTPAHLVAAYFQLTLNVSLVPHCFVVGGEPLPKKIVGDWLKLFPAAQFVNEYGPTETTVGCSIYTVTNHNFQDLPPLPSVPIGKPIPNARLYLLDTFGQIVPTGCTGELWISGNGVATGYLNADEVNNSRFITVENFHGLGPERLYRTGDLARFLPCGNLHFIGRVDNQVKLRGFRIELSEIESVLGESPFVHSVIVHMLAVTQKGLSNEHEDVIQSQLLVAYVVPSDSYLVNEQERIEEEVQTLRAHVALSLPDYMAPASYVVIKEFPLTANGKIDRSALPKPSFSSALNTFEPPETALEHTLRDIWLELLPTSKIGMQDDFFRLGGDSLLMMQMFAKIQIRFGIGISPRSFFDNPRLSYLADYIESAQHDVDLNEIPKVESRDAVSASPLQEQMWTLEQLRGQSYSPYVSCRGYDINGPLDVAALSAAIDMVVARHEALRTSFELDEDRGLVQRINTAPATVLKVHHPAPPIELGLSFDIEQFVSNEKMLSFDLSRDIPIRANLFQISDKQFVLLFTLHHIAYDAYSSRLLADEVGFYYKKFLQGSDVELAQPALQYIDYAAWLATERQSLYRENQLTYWKSVLNGVAMTNSLPLDFPRPQRPKFTASHASGKLGKATSTQLKDLCRTQGLTLFVGLYTAFAAALSSQSGIADTVVGIPVANRESFQAQSVFGYLANTVVLRATVDHQRSYQELLHTCKRIVRDAYTNQAVPFEQIVQAVKPKRQLNQNPIFQVMFTVDDSSQPQNSIFHDVDIQPRKISSTGASKFDVLFGVTDELENIHISVTYNSELFLPQRIEALIDAFIVAASKIVSDLDNSIDRGCV